MKLGGNAQYGKAKLEVQTSNPTVNVARWLSLEAGATNTLSFVMDSAGVSPITLTATDAVVGVSIKPGSNNVLAMDFTDMPSAIVGGSLKDILLVDNWGTDTATAAGAFSSIDVAGASAQTIEGVESYVLSDGTYYTLSYDYNAAAMLGAGHDQSATNDLGIGSGTAPPFPSRVHWSCWRAA